MGVEKNFVVVFAGAVDARSGTRSWRASRLALRVAARERLATAG
jgi:hypothetical protein